MDPVAHRLANALVGNGRTAATIEVTLAGPELRFAQSTRVAVAGADLSASIDDTPVPRDRAVECGPGSLLRFGRRCEGARAYVACDGGICVPPVLGSRSTHVVSGLGGMQGRRLRSGDLLPLGPAAAARPPRSRPAHVAALSRPTTSPARLRVMPGPQAGAFERGALDVFERGVYAVSSQSDRMGYRLTGGVRFRSRDDGEMISDTVFVGAVQVPPSGDPILLMADRQTTGGYPQIAIVITADLPVAAQLAPGDTVRFEFCSRADAVAALVADEKALLALE
jgi:antagonist of KipI